MIAPEKVRVWWDGEGDFLEVFFGDNKAADTLPTKDGKATVHLDREGNVVGFHILGVSKTTKGKPQNFELTPESD